MSASQITIKKVSVSDLDILLAYSKKTFYNFFAHLNDPANMEAYSPIAFTPQKMLAELTEPDSAFYFAMLNYELVGYLKLNFNNAQTEFQDKNALEVERIYVSRQHHGKHIGQQLLNFATETAVQKQLRYIWLGVWEHNNNAIGFYRHNGFEVFSSHEFVLGDDKQVDLLMKKALS